MSKFNNFCNEILKGYKQDNQSKLIKGSVISKLLLNYVENEVKLLKKNHLITPSLRVIMVGDNPISNIYVNNKKKIADEIGIDCQIIKLPNNISQEKLNQIIDENNQDNNIHAIIVQLPLPDHLSVTEVVSKIYPIKDADGFSPYNVGMLYSGIGEPVFSNFHTSCTPLGCIFLLKSVMPDDLSGKHAVIIGRSNIVGRPLASLLIRNNMTVTICHSQTKNLQDISSNADVIFTAIGKPKFFGPDYFKKNAIAIDIGISKNLMTNELSGDIDFENTYDKISYITPVPGGVGPMTIACLMLNTVNAAKLCLQKIMKNDNLASSN